MAVTARRRLETTATRRFGSGRDPYAIPDLTKIQTESYADFCSSTFAGQAQDSG